MRKAAVIALASVLACLTVAHAQAQPFPSKLIRIIVPFPPVGPNDLLARSIAQKMTEAFGVQTIVDNRPGANGVIGVEAVAKSPPNGYTLLIGSTGSLTIKPSLFPNLPFDPVRDFVPVSPIGSGIFVMVVHPSLGVKSVKEFVELAKSRPGELTFGSPGNGTCGHLSGEIMKMMAKLDMVHVPYKGGAPALNDLLGGQIAVLFSEISISSPHVKSGRIRALAVTSAKRSRILPDLPALSERGFPGFDVSIWYGLLAPAGTPREVVTKLNPAIVKMVRSPDVTARMESVGVEPLTFSADEFAEFVKKDVAKWAKVVKESGARVE
jgi:tripartite-type tricarboxylate transporter receptor subunit TctC